VRKLSKFALLVCLSLALLACSDSNNDVVPTQTFTVTVTERTFVDSSRGTPPTGEFPALPDRTLNTLVFVPDGNKRFPLLIFSHGLGGSPQFYQFLLEAGNPHPELFHAREQQGRHTGKVLGQLATYLDSLGIVFG